MAKNLGISTFNRITIFMIVMMLPFQAAKAEKLTLVADIWCPYNCEPESDKPGYMVEIAKAAFAKHGITVEYIVMPWARAIEDTRNNKYNAIIGAYYRDAPDFIYPDTPQGKCQNAYYVKKESNWRYEGIASLEAKTLGVVSDYSYSEELDAYIEKNSKDKSKIQKAYGDNATINNLKKLSLGRVNAIVEDIQVTEYYLSQDHLSNLKNSFKNAGIVPDETDGSGIVFIAFSPNNEKSKKYAKILSDETNIMLKNGELQKILSKYGIKNFIQEE